METNKKNGEENNIDEDYLMSIMAGSTKKESANTKPITSDETHLPKSKNKAKKNNDIKYVEQFLTHHTMNKRGDTDRDRMGYSGRRSRQFYAQR